MIVLSERVKSRGDQVYLRVPFGIGNEETPDLRPPSLFGTERSVGKIEIHWQPEMDSIYSPRKRAFPNEIATFQVKARLNW